MEETKPRITITAELFEKLKEDEGKLEDLRTVAEELGPQVFTLMHRYDQRKVAAERLVSIHKAKDAVRIEKLEGAIRAQRDVAVRFYRELVKVSRERDEARALVRHRRRGTTSSEPDNSTEEN